MIVLRASDAVVTFYLPAPDDPSLKPEFEPGFFAYDYGKYDINRVCQSVSLHRLQVEPPFLGEPWDKKTPMFANVDPIPELRHTLINDRILKAARAGQVKELTGITITPVIRIVNGIRTSVVPGRTKLWSPVVDVPGLGLERLFLWTHADFWWEVEKITIDPMPEVAAARDLVAFDIVNRMAPVFGPDLAREDTRSHAADVLEAYCAELEDLLDARGNDEEAIHQWLFNRQHWLFLDPHPRNVWSKLPFGDKISDFVVRSADNTYSLIEIEPGNQAILKRADGEPTARFNHACQQVRDWKRYIRDNVHTVRSELGLEDIDNPGGMVIMGRSADIERRNAQTRWRDMKATGDLRLFTFDELCDSVRALAGELRAIC
jgi:hypothetical protein